MWLISHGIMTFLSLFVVSVASQLIWCHTSESSICEVSTCSVSVCQIKDMTNQFSVKCSYLQLSSTFLLMANVM